jgi:hypothetical protein
MLQEPKHGLCVIDPHGDLIDDILALVPESRLDDVILFDPSVVEHPFCLNLFAPVPAPEEIGRVASEIVAIFRKILGGAWTPEIEGVIQNAALTLLCRPSGFELQGSPWVPALDEIPALLAMEMVPEGDRDKPPWKRSVTTYRSQFYRLLQEQDQIPVWEFWNYNFDTLTPRPRSELSFAVLNQVRRFLANPTVRNIVGQTESRLDLRTVMDEGRILLVKLSKGLLGEANSAFLGSVIVAKLVVGVFGRPALREAQRRPFHIIVDEFQNFAISSFPALLAEGRKYDVDLVIAHQYRDQLRDWVQGATVNAGNVVCFRLGGDDALELAREFDASPPVAEPEKHAVYVEVETEEPGWARSLESLVAPLCRWRDADDWATAQWSMSKGGGGTVRSTEPVLFSKDDRIDSFFYWLEAVAAGPDASPELRQQRGRSRMEFYAWVLDALADPAATAWAKEAYDDLPAWALQKEERNAKRRAESGGLHEPERDRTYLEDFPEIRAWMLRHRPSEPVMRSLRLAIQYLRERSEANRRYVQARTREQPMYQDIAGRPRLYSDVFQQIANELTHLPNFQARCKLSGSAERPVESAFRMAEWPEGSEDAAERQERKLRNEADISANTVRDFTRPKEEVVGAFKERYERMLRSIGMSWSPDDPLPKPQVLYEDDD